jgi:hypothetical protein
VGEEDAGVIEGTAAGSARGVRATGLERVDGEQRHGMGYTARRSLALRAGALGGRERGGVGMSGRCDERIMPWRDGWRRTRGHHSPSLPAASGKRRTFESEHYQKLKFLLFLSLGITIGLVNDFLLKKLLELFLSNFRLGIQFGKKKCY